MRAQLEPLLKWATPSQKGFTDAVRRKYQATSPSLTQLKASQASSSRAAGSSNPTSSQASQRSSSQLTPAQIERARVEKERAERQRAEQIRAIELQNMLSSLEKLDDDGRRASILDNLCISDGILDIPEYEKEVPGLSSTLLKHQVSCDKVNNTRVVFIQDFFVVYLETSTPMVHRSRKPCATAERG